MHLQSLYGVRLLRPARRCVGHTTPVMRVQGLVQLPPSRLRVRLLQGGELAAHQVLIPLGQLVAGRVHRHHRGWERAGV